MFFFKFPRSRKMLAPLHGPIEQCPPFNGLNIEIFHDSTSCWKKCKLWKCCLSTQITEWQIHDICVALTTCVFQSHSGCGAPTDSRVQVIFTYRRNYILAIKYEVIIAFHCNLHGIYIYIYILYSWYRDATKYVKNVAFYRISGGRLTNYLFAMQINIA